MTMVTRTSSTASGQQRDFSLTDETERKVVKSAPGKGFRPIPDALIERYVVLAVRDFATLEELEDGSGWYAYVSRLRGVHGEGETEEAALESLASAVHAWVRFKMERRHGDIPPIADIDLNRG